MKGGQVIELLAFFAGMAWVIGFTISKASGRTNKSWWAIILLPLEMLIIAVVLIVIQQYILPRHHHHRPD